MDNHLVFHPIISSIQKIILYETKSKFYLVGTNNTQTRFRVLKIDRMEPRELIIHDDKVEYTKNEIHNLVTMIDSGNRQKSGSGFSNITSAFGIVGFIRFLEGYYIILVTKRRKAAVIGYHTIYKIECTSMIYIPHDSVRLLHPDEPRYYKMFQGVDLSSNFYFSYSYDVTHTLQHNMSPPNRIIPNHVSDDLAEPTDSQPDRDPPLFPTSQGGTVPKEPQQPQEYGVRAKPHRRFVWNGHLIRPVEKLLHPDWIVYVGHGFVGQANVSVFGRPVYVTLLARRSSRYAGTRFLKRGANSRGDVANEVETEQIVHDSHISALHRSRIASFVQLRGSIPGQWRQDMGRVVAKPAITIDLHDPLAEVAGAHFTDLLKRYGGPIVVLNLVKRHERKAQERLLSDELLCAIRYLTQFLPQGSQGTGHPAPLQYRAFDMARKNKSSAADVMGQLAGIARAAVNKTGFFYSRGNSKTAAAATVQLQTGVVRTNCVDCLDRTNTAQFALGRCALGAQLLALGLMATPGGPSATGTLLPFDCDCVRMLESLYEDHGDTLALQYGGSQLVHRVQTYRKTAPWTSHGNDIMQTLSRYYSNTFSDADKQCSMNLFLGLYECTSFTSGTSGSSSGNMAIWDLPSDHYLHHIPRPLFNMAPSYRSMGQSLWAALGPHGNQSQLGQCQLPLDTQQRAVCELIRVLDGAAGGAEMVDAFADYHRPYELNSLTDHYAYQLDHSVRDYMPSGTLDCNPFRVRVRPGRRREQQSSGTHSTTSTITNPSLSGLSSNSSAASSNSSSTDDGENSESSTLDCEDLLEQSTHRASTDLANAKVTFESLFPPFDVVYGTQVKKEVNRNDMLLYKKYVLVGRRATATTLQTSDTSIKNSFNNDTFNNSKDQFKATDSSYSVKVPVIQNKDLDVYRHYVNSGLHGGTTTNAVNVTLYRKYVMLR